MYPYLKSIAYEDLMGSAHVNQFGASITSDGNTGRVLEVIQVQILAITTTNVSCHGHDEDNSVVVIVIVVVVVGGGVAGTAAVVVVVVTVVVAAAAVVVIVVVVVVVVVQPSPREESNST